MTIIEQDICGLICTSCSNYPVRVYTIIISCLCVMFSYFYRINHWRVIIKHIFRIRNFIGKLQTFIWFFYQKVNSCYTGVDFLQHLYRVQIFGIFIYEVAYNKVIVNYFAEFSFITIMFISKQRLFMFDSCSLCFCLNSFSIGLYVYHKLYKMARPVFALDSINY